MRNFFRKFYNRFVVPFYHILFIVNIVLSVLVYLILPTIISWSTWIDKSINLPQMFPPFNEIDTITRIILSIIAGYVLARFIIPIFLYRFSVMKYLIYLRMRESAFYIMYGGIPAAIFFFIFPIFLLNTDVLIARLIAPHANTIRWTATAIIFVTFVAIRYTSLRMKAARNIGDIISHSVHLHLEFRRRAEDLSKRGMSKENKRQDLSWLARDHSIYLCDKIAEIFMLMTLYPCHACVKSLDRTSGEITTRARDSLFHNRSRKEGDEIHEHFPHRNNSAFIHILENRKAHMFVCNNLTLNAIFRKYTNTKPLWSQYYNATVVVPITLNTDPANITLETVTGFICVDNFPGRFDRRNALVVLRTFAVLFHDVNLMLGRTDL